MAHSKLTENVQDDHQDGSIDGDGGDKVDLQPITTLTTKKVERLLCKLCLDPSVGKQLRPHLFGLLELSGASYPPNAVHVADSALNIIVSFAGECLNSNLVVFLHDRQMMVHMTDDTKELCGISNSATSPTATYCLRGQAAESHGLWVVALRAIVHMVKQSCSHHSFELLKDFDSSGGYHVLCYAQFIVGRCNIYIIISIKADQ
jgi:hypothetical protein